jgi:hypothetical protein
MIMIRGTVESVDRQRLDLIAEETSAKKRGSEDSDCLEGY